MKFIVTNSEGYFHQISMLSFCKGKDGRYHYFPRMWWGKGYVISDVKTLRIIQKTTAPNGIALVAVAGLQIGLWPSLDRADYLIAGILIFLISLVLLWVMKEGKKNKEELEKIISRLKVSEEKYQLDIVRRLLLIPKVEIREHLLRSIFIGISCSLFLLLPFVFLEKLGILLVAFVAWVSAYFHFRAWHIKGQKSR